METKKTTDKNYHWVFTLNNPEEQINWDQANTKNLIKYVIWQKEIGESGTPHYQGYIELSRQARLSQMKKMLPGAHWETRRGTREQARDYCTKSETKVEGPWEYGIWKESLQGKRTDLDNTILMANNKEPREVIIKANPHVYIKYSKGVEAYIQVARDKGNRTEKTRVELYIGIPGTGKSYNAAFEKDAYWKSPDKWWDGYTQQDVVVMDDFSGWLQWTQLLHIMDAYPCDVETKGGKIKFNSKKIIITTNYHPKEWYSDEKRPRPLEAVLRRLDKIVICTRKAHYVAQGDRWEERVAWLEDHWTGGKQPVELKEGWDKPCWWEKQEEVTAEPSTAPEGKEEQEEPPAKRRKGDYQQGFIAVEE